MYEPVPPPAPAHHKDTPPSQLGIEALVGGGAVGFIDTAVRNTVNTGGAWDARMVFGSRLPIAIEGAYVGSAQTIDVLGLTSNSRLIGNGVEGDLRLNFTNYKVQPYIFGGAGWTRYQISNNNTINTSSVLSSDDVGTVPLGAGISIRPSKVFLIDLRGTYRAVFDDTMFDRDDEHQQLDAELERQRPRRLRVLRPTRAPRQGHASRGARDPRGHAPSRGLWSLGSSFVQSHSVSALAAGALAARARGGRRRRRAPPPETRG